MEENNNLSQETSWKKHIDWLRKADILIDPN